MNNLVSVIIPTFNRAATIERAIKSVLNQTYTEFEVIIVDDGSKDNSESIIRGLNDRRITYLKHASCRGAAAARNTGIQASKGKFIAFQDSDDEWVNDKLEIQVKLIDANNEIDLIYSDLLRINNSGCEEYFTAPVLENAEIVNLKTKEYSPYMLGLQTVIIRREIVITKNIYFDENLHRFIDLDFFIRLILNGVKFYCVRKPLVKYFEQENCITKNDTIFVETRKLLLEKYWGFIKDKTEFLSEEYYRLWLHLYRHHRFNEGKVYLYKAFKLRPFNLKYIIVYFLAMLSENLFIRIAKFKKDVHLS